MAEQIITVRKSGPLVHLSLPHHYPIYWRWKKVISLFTLRDSAFSDTHTSVFYSCATLEPKGIPKGPLTGNNK